MERFGILLDSGVSTGEFYADRTAAWAAINRWRHAREDALKSGSMVVPRRVAALVHVRCKSAPARAEVIRRRAKRKP